MHEYACKSAALVFNMLYAIYMYVCCVHTKCQMCAIHTRTSELKHILLYTIQYWCYAVALQCPFQYICMVVKVTLYMWYIQFIAAFVVVRMPNGTVLWLRWYMFNFTHTRIHTQLAIAVVVVAVEEYVLSAVYNICDSIATHVCKPFE